MRPGAGPVTLGRQSRVHVGRMYVPCCHQPSHDKRVHGHWRLRVLRFNAVLSVWPAGPAERQFMYVVSVTKYSWLFVVTWICVHLGDFQEENLIAVLYVKEETSTDDTVPMCIHATLASMVSKQLLHECRGSCSRGTLYLAEAATVTSPSV